MTIIPKEKVRQAYARAIALDDCPLAAVQSVAQALGLSVETVAEAVREVQA